MEQKTKIHAEDGKQELVLKLPFAQGLNMAHNRIQDTLTKLK
jgi:hypothetical protein